MTKICFRTIVTIWLTVVSGGVWAVGHSAAQSDDQRGEVSLSEKVAQMVVLGFRGTDTAHNAQLVSDLVETGIGGVILFEHNIAPVLDGVDSRAVLRQLCAELQCVVRDAGREQLIIAIDQEGGMVNRLKPKYGFPASVSAQYLGELNCEDTTRSYYAAMADALVDVGINVNFGPSVDLNINPQCPVIGRIGRSFSCSESVVNRHAGFFIDEHHRRGIRTSLKHFPGHGSSMQDSHLGFTDVTETWTKRELGPYKYFIDRGLCDMVMVSHTFNAKLDPQYPATLSRRTVDSLLRQQMGYQGLVVTDDMNMKAITANYSFAEAMALTINAGVDLIIISNNIKGADNHGAQHIVDTIVDLVERGVVPRSRIDESYDRIMSFKRDL